MSQSEKMSPILKLLVEAGPLMIFFTANAYAGIFWATGIFMVVSFFALIFSWMKTGKIAVIPLIGAIFVGVFGVLTLWLHNDLFIKLKVSLVNGLFGFILLSGLVFDRPFLKQFFGETIDLQDIGWRILTYRWMIFFFSIALLNEFIWRNFSTDFWVNFKVFGLMPITFSFALLQLPLMQRYGSIEK